MTAPHAHFYTTSNGRNYYAKTTTEIRHGAPEHYHQHWAAHSSYSVNLRCAWAKYQTLFCDLVNGSGFSAVLVLFHQFSDQCKSYHIYCKAFPSARERSFCQQIWPMDVRRRHSIHVIGGEELGAKMQKHMACLFWSNFVEQPKTHCHCDRTFRHNEPGNCSCRCEQISIHLQKTPDTLHHPPRDWAESASQGLQLQTARMTSSYLGEKISDQVRTRNETIVQIRKSNALFFLHEKGQMELITGARTVARRKVTQITRRDVFCTCAISAGTLLLNVLLHMPHTGSVHQQILGFIRQGQLLPAGFWFRKRKHHTVKLLHRTSKACRSLLRILLSVWVHSSDQETTA